MLRLIQPFILSLSLECYPIMSTPIVGLSTVSYKQTVLIREILVLGPTLVVGTQFCMKVVEIWCIEQSKDNHG